ncbi:tyrosine-type recombinase/integrase [Paraflavitalea speifideaquila]|uniref:tyrosine-type recombinase/integrase n=1 Tax=Paraflavitalea speifideaquila TaxID=3076558 RepID=UPI0028EFE6D3|nr:site-specific integrase [Paraflavitalea speifideiaquila]
MDHFKQYLQAKRHTPRTIDEHLLNVNRFITWATEQQHIGIAEIRYNDLLVYIQQEKGKGIRVETINLRLASINKYLEYLKVQGELEKNPAKNLRVKGELQKVIRNPLNRVELDTLYQQYCQLKKVANHQQQADQAHGRNIVILGLLVFQGVHSGELQKMEVGHVDLNAGTVYIPSTNQGSSRQLELSQKQVIPLHRYLSVIRRHLKPKGEELIPGSVRSHVLRLMQEIQGLNPIVTNALHIRGSVILNWLKIHPKRQVQYMAGHKYISSTEKYAAQEVEDLQDALTKHHPFG